MASPQKENGYTPIAHEILEALAQAKISGYEFRFIIALLRKTYGYGKKEDKITNSQICKIINAPRQRISEAKLKLLAKNIVTQKRDKISFNKDYDKWKVSRKIVTPVTQKRDKVSRKSVHTIDKKIIYKRYTASRLKKSMKKNKFGSYNEDQHTDSNDGEVQIDPDYRKPTGGARGPDMDVLISWAQKKMEKKFVSQGKQRKHIAAMFSANYTIEDIQKKWEHMEEDKFWGTTGFDFSNVANEIGKATKKKRGLIKF